MTYPEFISQWRDGSSTVSCRTSGSTGTPKIIELPKKEMERSAWRTIRFFGLSEKSVLYSCISPDYIGGKMMAVRAETLGCKLVYEVPTNRPLQNFHGNEIDLLAVVPSQMLYILDHLEEMPVIRNIIIGGSKIPYGLRMRISESNLNAWETYGMTETASHIALRKVQKIENPFIPLDGINVNVNNNSCLEIEMVGWQRLSTNDIVEMDKEGAFRIIGRKDSIIITGGKKVNPIEIEEALEEHFNVQVLITSEEDEKWGERVIAVVEDTSGKVNETELLDFCRARFRAEQIPKRILVGIIPKTENGKKARKKESLNADGKIKNDIK